MNQRVPAKQRTKFLINLTKDPTRLSIRRGLGVVGDRDTTAPSTVEVTGELAREAVALVRSVPAPKATHSFIKQPKQTPYSMITDAENEEKLEIKYRRKQERIAHRNAVLAELVQDNELEVDDKPRSMAVRDRMVAKINKRNIKVNMLEDLLDQDGDDEDPDTAVFTGAGILGQLGYEGLNVNRATLAMVISRMRGARDVGIKVRGSIGEAELVLAQAADDCINARKAVKAIFERWASRGPGAAKVDLKKATPFSYKVCGKELINSYPDLARHSRGQIRHIGIDKDTGEIQVGTKSAMYTKTISAFGPSIPLSDALLDMIKVDIRSYTLDDLNAFRSEIQKVCNAHFCGTGDVKGQQIRLESVMDYQIKTQTCINDLKTRLSSSPNRPATHEDLVRHYLKLGSNYFIDYNKVGDVGPKIWELLHQPDSNPADFRPISEWVEALSEELPNGDWVKRMEFNPVNLHSQAGPGYGMCSKGDVMEFVLNDAEENYRNFMVSIDSTVGLSTVLAAKPEVQYVYLKPKNEPYKLLATLGMHEDFSPTSEWIDECVENNPETEKIRTIYVSNAGLTYELNLISNLLFKSAQTCFDNRGELMDSECFSMHGFGPTGGNVDLFCRRLQCIKPFQPKMDSTERFVTGYSDNAYLKGELSDDFSLEKYPGLIDNVIAPRSMQGALDSIKESGIIPAGTMCLFSIDGKRMESSIDFAAQCAAMSLLCDALRAPADKRRYYMECILPLLAKPKGLFGNVEVQLEMNTSGNPLTFYNNDFKMFCIIQDYIFNHGSDTEIDPEIFVRCAKNLGTYLTIERVVILPGLGKPVIELGESLDIDLLGNSITSVAMGNPFDDLPLIVGKLEPIRLYKALCFDRTEDRLSDVTEAAASKAISLTVSSGMVSGVLADTLTSLVIQGRSVFFRDSNPQEGGDAVAILEATRMKSDLVSSLKNIPSDSTVDFYTFSRVKAVLTEIFVRVNTYPIVEPPAGIITARVGPALFGGTFNKKLGAPGAYAVASQAARYIRQLNVLVAQSEGSFNGTLNVNGDGEVISYEPSKRDLEKVKELYDASGFLSSGKIIRKAIGTAMRIKPTLTADYRDAMLRGVNHAQNRLLEIAENRARNKAIKKALKTKPRLGEATDSSTAGVSAPEFGLDLRSYGKWDLERGLMSLRKTKLECIRFDESEDSINVQYPPLLETKEVISYINAYTGRGLMSFLAKAAGVTHRDLFKTKRVGVLRDQIRLLPLPDELNQNYVAQIEDARQKKILEPVELLALSVHPPTINPGTEISEDTREASVDLGSLLERERRRVITQLRTVEETEVSGPLSELLSLNLAIELTRIGLSSCQFGTGDIWYIAVPGGFIPPDILRGKGLSSYVKVEPLLARRQEPGHFSLLPASIIAEPKARQGDRKRMVKEMNKRAAEL